MGNTPTDTHPQYTPPTPIHPPTPTPTPTPEGLLVAALEVFDLVNQSQARLGRPSSGLGRMGWAAAKRREATQSPLLHWLSLASFAPPTNPIHSPSHPPTLPTSAYPIHPPPPIHPIHPSPSHRPDLSFPTHLILLPLPQCRELCQAVVQCHVPCLPQWVVVGGWQLRVGDWLAGVGVEDPLCQQVVPEETGHKEVLSVQLLKGVWGRKVLPVTKTTSKLNLKSSCSICKSPS